MGAGCQQFQRLSSGRLFANQQYVQDPPENIEEDLPQKSQMKNKRHKDYLFF
jgi:hypothetical protein